MFFVLVIALIAAGVYTQATIWYILAGVLFGFAVLVQVVALLGVGMVAKKVNKEFKDFDKGFDSDFFKNNRRNRRF
jgi:hypothetical protein